MALIVYEIKNNKRDCSYPNTLVCLSEKASALGPISWNPTFTPQSGPEETRSLCKCAARVTSVNQYHTRSDKEPIVTVAAVLYERCFWTSTPYYLDHTALYKLSQLRNLAKLNRNSCHTLLMDRQECLSTKSCLNSNNADAAQSVVCPVGCYRIHPQPDCTKGAMLICLLERYRLVNM